MKNALKKYEKKIFKKTKVISVRNLQVERKIIGEGINEGEIKSSIFPILN